jgi:hypothetical protein
MVDGADVTTVMRMVLCDAQVVASLRLPLVKFTERKVKKRTEKIL